MGRLEQRKRKGQKLEEVNLKNCKRSTKSVKTPQMITAASPLSDNNTKRPLKQKKVSPRMSSSLSTNKDIREVSSFSVPLKNLSIILHRIDVRKTVFTTPTKNVSQTFKKPKYKEVPPKSTASSPGQNTFRNSLRYPEVKTTSNKMRTPRISPRTPRTVVTNPQRRVSPRKLFPSSVSNENKDNQGSSSVQISVESSSVTTNQVILTRSAYSLLNTPTKQNQVATESKNSSSSPEQKIPRRNSVMYPAKETTSENIGIPRRSYRKLFRLKEIKILQKPIDSPVTHRRNLSRKLDSLGQSLQSPKVNSASSSESLRLKQLTKKRKIFSDNSSSPTNYSVSINAETSSNNEIIETTQGSSSSTKATSISDDSPSTSSSKASSGYNSQVEDEWRRMIPVLIDIADKCCRCVGNENYFNKKMGHCSELESRQHSSITKTRVDFPTIRANLLQENYKNPWEFIADVTLIFDIARRNNTNKTLLEKVDKSEEVFNKLIEESMKDFGYCCGKYELRVIYCQRVECISIIRFGESYFTNCNYDICKKCYDTASDLIKCRRLTKGAVTITRNIRKSNFLEETNVCSDVEPFVSCQRCFKKYHSYCVLFLEEIFRNGFTCPSCLQKNRSPKPVNDFTAKNFPQTDLSNFLEERIKNFLEEKNVLDCEVIIRVTSICNRVVEVKPQMKKLFEEKDLFPTGFPYRAKSIFAFKVIDGVEVMFFGMYAQEYGTDCPGPNSRCIYLSYLDSVHYFQPKELRTSVYQEIILGYFVYVKNLGFTEVHIWSCPPPATNPDYLFLHHPPEQKIPDADRLIEWYKSLIIRGKEFGIVEDYKDLLSEMKSRNLSDVANVPYFDGDYLPADAVELEIKRTNRSPKSPTVKNSSLLERIYRRLERERDSLLVIRLQSVDSAKSIIVDPNREFQGCFMDTRKNFVEYSRKEKYNFSTLRKAKFSTMAMMFKVFTGIQINCSSCPNPIRSKSRFLCTNIACFPFGMCSECHEENVHPHKLIFLPEMAEISESPEVQLPEDTVVIETPPPNDVPNIDNQSGDPEVEILRELPNPNIPDSTKIFDKKAKVEHLMSYADELKHASKCRISPCEIQSCLPIRELIKHEMECRTGEDGDRCTTCFHFVVLSVFHGFKCQDKDCDLKYCKNSSTPDEWPQIVETIRHKVTRRS